MERTAYLKPNTVNYKYTNTNTLTEIERVKAKLNQESHLFIICFGMLIGTIFSLFIGYHLNTTFINIFLLMALPIALTYWLRKVYIHTLIHYQE
ncbi:FUSC family protein [Acinetobacter sichuanensis]|uniref:FUSC family protein n=1 Tax=Acinetobacter sichuanensis TaxID=2136183 RepID=A0A371YVA4_9GAMM|nr:MULTISPECIES: FUSC family protein [Acinetobacter]MDM1763587.1 FUSC family protein [Acinetobacter sp. 226-1]MDM1767066.1 FUSC family protein [Acinetobacter sp. 226-4]MDQ9019780.1 FUSC family protein [Acinetobacter sichuanensis]RFC85397.1 FUSC family protein [Acinetobacter sichuanensis]